MFKLNAKVAFEKSISIIPNSLNGIGLLGHVIVHIIWCLDELAERWDSENHGWHRLSMGQNQR